MRLFAKISFALLLVLLQDAFGQDAELTNYKSGIDVTWGGTKGTDYYEEYFYHDKLVDDHKVVYIRSTTPISMGHNARNNAQYPAIPAFGSQKFKVIGIDGLDGVPNSGDEGIIRYKIDRDRQWNYKWAANSAGSDVASVLPAYSGPFTLASQTYVGSGTPVVGSTGWVGSPSSKSSYYRGILDSVGDEWHVLAYADDDRAFLWGDGTASVYTVNGVFVDQAFYASDGKTVLLVVDPKTPCLTTRVTGTGQFYTTPPKAYFNPKIYPQTTYIAPGSSGTVTIELRNIYGTNISYRINGGSTVAVGAATVTLSDSAFSAGSNTLEYWYDSTPSVKRTRTVVKNPPHPSLSETHGYALWSNDTEYAAAVSRLSRAPYATYYSGFKTRRDNSAQLSWDSSSGAKRTVSPYYALENAFVAKVEGISYKIAASPKTHFQYAKEMMLTAPNDKIGFEMNHSSDAVPNRETWYRGYYDTLPNLKKAFAYDLFAGYWRDDQVTGGMTAIENLKVRDDMAGYVYNAMQDSMSINPVGAPGMWGGARMMFGTTAGVIMPEYSTPYYGTSGFGTVQTTYPNCPYDSDQYTWKQALFDGQTRTSYPNFTWNLGLGNNGSDSLFFDEGAYSIYFGGPIPKGNWIDKNSYLSSGLMGIHFQIFANMSQRRVGSLDSFLVAANQLMMSSTGIVGFKDNQPGVITNGTTTITASTAKWADGQFDPVPGQNVVLSKPGGLTWTTRTISSISNNTTMDLNSPVTAETGAFLFFPGRWAQLCMINDAFPTLAASNRPWVQGLPSTRGESDDKAMQDAGVWGFVWYDDAGGGGDAVPPTVSSRTIPSGGTTAVFVFSEPVVFGAGGNSGFTFSLSGGAVTATYASGSGSSTLTYSLSRTVSAGETGTVSYTQPGNGIEDTAGNDLATFGATSITIVGAGSDTTLPTISVTTPSGSVTVASSTYTTFAGTAADNVGVTSVTWSSGAGDSGTATGTTSWSIPTITLQPGDNVISVQSRDAAGNLSTAATRTITYSLPPIVGGEKTHINPRNRRFFGR